MSLLVREMRRPRTLACPLLLTRSRTLFKLGYPQVMYGSQILSILVVALLSLMKTPLLIWSRRKSFRVLDLGADLVHTSNTDDESQSRFSGDIEVSFLLGLAGQA